MKFLKIVLEEKLKGKIREIEEAEGEMFAGIEVFFKDDHTETWMNENLIKIDKPELVKKAEKYLDRITKKIIQEQKKEDKTPLHSTTPLDSWTKR